ncbi:VPLPA-CTERM sorting domain-containing protein [uncultured Roseobacter sp.]|uniref:VPLPA-CTERM sorting domain-containing protein n=1 Tax=uncultured Roseobacter sp. TaxID=114847 RepID=UPI00261071B3|nr:VPLPA-CTERM sorting domain-containing protein [uncultured Roseobacter sp.]
MRNIFTFFLSAGLGLTAAVGATSLNNSSFSAAEGANSARVAGVQFDAQSAPFSAGGGAMENGVQPTSDSTISFFRTQSLDTPVEIAALNLDTDSFEPDLLEETAEEPQIVQELLEVVEKKDAYTPASFSGSPFNLLRTGSGGSGSAGSGGGSGTPASTSPSTLERESVAVVPLPASALLFGSAFLGFRIMRRRKKA